MPHLVDAAALGPAYDEANFGFGDARFPPFDDSLGARVLTLYRAETEAAALLETVLRDVHHGSARIVYLNALAGHALARIVVPLDLRVVDMRDEELARLGVSRSELVSSPAEHYPCTRRIAAALHESGVGGAPVHGLVWHSRRAEVAEVERPEVLVVFADRCARGRGGWPLALPGVRDLVEGAGSELVDDIAESLDAMVQHDWRRAAGARWQ